MTPCLPPPPFKQLYFVFVFVSLFCIHFCIINCIHICIFNCICIVNCIFILYFYFVFVSLIVFLFYILWLIALCPIFLNSWIFYRLVYFVFSYLYFVFWSFLSPSPLKSCIFCMCWFLYVCFVFVFCIFGQFELVCLFKRLFCLLTHVKHFHFFLPQWVNIQLAQKSVIVF